MFSLADGCSVADPFDTAAGALELLMLRTRQLRRRRFRRRMRL